jgi:lycopene epsilon-cyclase
VVSANTCNPAWSGDGLVIGAGPAALAIAAELGERGLSVAALAPAEPSAPWANTYGIWAREVDDLGLGHLLSHRWDDSVSHFGPGGGDPEGLIRHGRAYGLFDKAALQGYWLERCARSGVRWHQGRAKTIHHDATCSTVTTAEGEAWRARLVVDASGHAPVFVRRGGECDGSGRGDLLRRGNLAGPGASGALPHPPSPPASAPGPSGRRGEGGAA